jgi:hypothetical protein
MVKVKTYEELLKYGEFFLEGKVPLMILSGLPGIGKSEEIKQLTEGRKGVRYVEGYQTKTQFVKMMYEHPDDFIIVNDTDNLFQDKAMFGMLRVGFDTNDDRHINYESPSPFVADIPRDFRITGNMLIITNGLAESTVMNAFKSRAVCVDFAPTPKEITTKLKSIILASTTIPKDQEVFNLFERLAPVSKEPNFRAYILSAKLKPKGIDWRNHLAETMKVNPLLSAMVEATQEGKTYKQRAKRFVELTNKSERTYSRLLKQYRGVLP